MAEQPFYSIYDKLITGKDDVIGMLAYSIYKQHKIEFIEDFKRKKGKCPEDSDFEYFIMSSVAPSQLKKYRESARAILSENVAAAVQDELLRIDIDFQKSIDSVVKRHTDDVEKVVEKHAISNWKTIGLNIASSFFILYSPGDCFYLWLYYGKWFADKDKSCDRNHTRKSSRTSRRFGINTLNATCFFL